MQSKKAILIWWLYLHGHFSLGLKRILVHMFMDKDEIFRELSTYFHSDD